MKQDMDKLDLRGAFRQEPQSCHDALMAAARSVKEERPMKKASLRTVLIAAAIILATMAAAVAAGSLLGWTDYFGQQYGIAVPQTAQRILGEAWNTHSFTLGPVTFTTKELLCDGHIAMASTEIAMTDKEDNALLCADPFDAIGAVGNGCELAQRLGLDPGTPCWTPPSSWAASCTTCAPSWSFPPKSTAATPWRIPCGARTGK